MLADLLKSVFGNVERRIMNGNGTEVLTNGKQQQKSESNGKVTSAVNGKTTNGLEDESNSLDCNDDSCDMSSVCTEGTEESQSSSTTAAKRKLGKGKRSKKRLKTSSTANRKRMPYVYGGHMKEPHGLPLFGVTFNTYLQYSGRYVFAVCGSNKVSIYECLPEGGIKLHQTYSDPDKDEIFYCCTWTFNSDTKESLLITAGARGIIRIINPSKTSYQYLRGHGMSINDLKTHPNDHNILMSVSKDHSIRLWNVKTLTCIAIFGGVEGHRDEVLYADFHKKGHKIISCGMDHSLKIWSLESDDINNSIKESYTYDNFRSERPFPTARIHFPNFTTRDIHRNYVDCVSWFGNFVISKSCENALVFWKPGKIEQDLDTFLPKSQPVTDSTTTFIHQLDLKDSEIWYMRFSMDMEQKTLALGNMTGKTYVWNVDADEPEDYTCSILTHDKCHSALRQTCLSDDGSILLCVGDDSTIWRWNREPTYDAKASTTQSPTPFAN